MIYLIDYQGLVIIFSLAIIKFLLQLLIPK